jgi:ribonuclease HI
LLLAVVTELWSDGACSGNPGPGGWAFILIAGRADGAVAKKLEGHGGEDMTTNNRMELRAALEGLLALSRPTTLTIHPDSAYLASAFTEGWLAKWQSNGWKSGKKPVKNQDLWGCVARRDRAAHRDVGARQRAQHRRAQQPLRRPRHPRAGHSRRAHSRRYTPARVRENAIERISPPQPGRRVFDWTSATHTGYPRA